MRYLAPILLLCLSACSTAPRSSGAYDARRVPSYAIYMTGYEVPQPASIPYAEPEARREYLRFYHYAYLTTMWQDYGSSSSLTPISDHPHAAIDGHHAGQHDAHRDKAAYWRERGRTYRPGPIGYGGDLSEFIGEQSDGE